MVVEAIGMGDTLPGYGSDVSPDPWIFKHRGAVSRWLAEPKNNSLFLAAANGIFIC